MEYVHLEHCRQFSAPAHTGFSFTRQIASSQPTFMWSGNRRRPSSGLTRCALRGAADSAALRLEGLSTITSAIQFRTAMAKSVTVSDDSLTVDLVDGRTITVPLAWFPRLSRGTISERVNWRFIGRGTGIHWPDLDEDISVESLLAGQRSGETQDSLRRWIGSRKTAG
jgi:hypothetical protein